jgi:predicted methyltransferase
MTIDEYNELITVQNKPSDLLKAENKNLKHHLDVAQTKIKELETGLSQYIISGMKPISTPSAEPEYTTTPNASSYQKWSHLEDLLILDTEYSVSNIIKRTGRTRGSILSRIAHLGYRTKNDRIYKKEY